LDTVLETPTFQDTTMDADTIDDLKEAPPDGGAKRRQIMEGARAEFLKSGFDGASMNDVARTAGVSKGTLYVYFDSKERLFEALIREERRQQAERLCIRAFDHGDPRDVLIKFGCNLMTMMSQPDHLAHVRTVIATSGKFPQLGRAFFEAGPLYGVTKLADYFAEQTKLGTLNVPEPTQAAWQFMALCQGGMYKQLLFGMVDHVSHADTEANVTAGVDVFMSAFGPTKV